MADERLGDEEIRRLYRQAGGSRSTGAHIAEQTWVPLASGTLPAAERTGAFDHIVGCDRCRQTWRGVSSFDEQARADGLGPDTRRTWRPAAPAGWLALAAGLILAVAGAWLYPQRQPSPAIPPVASNRPLDTTVAKPAAPPWLAAFSLVKADIHVAPADAFRVRGAPRDVGAPVDALARALEPYRRDEYQGAVEQLSSLATQYPQSDRPNLYLGVSLLFLDRPQEAVAPLRTATQSVLPAVARDARWYLAVALARAGQPDAALSEVEGLCAGGGSDAARACAARDALRVRSR